MSADIYKVLLVSLLPVLVFTGCEHEPAPEPVVDTNTKKLSESCLTDNTIAHAGVNSSPNLHREVWIEGREFTKGSNARYREEAPAHPAKVSGFWIDIHEVTNQQFAVFVDKTNYVTTAEQTPLPSNYPDIPADKLQPGSAMFVPPVSLNAGMREGHWTQWWQFVPGANWRHPEGPQSNLDGREHYPVVHVSYLDAMAYAKWLGRSLPKESQWELAAQGAPGSYGTESQQQNQSANTWQGFFPMQDKATDGYAGAAPVGCYPPGASGLHDMIGNVWEWVSDIYQPGHSPGISTQSTGPVPVRVIKGGSHLCAENYCRRNAPQARQPQEEDFGVAHLGFRTVRNEK